MFPPPSPPCNVVPLFELPLENKKHPNFEWRGQGRGVDSYVSEVTLFEYNVSTILSPIVACSSRSGEYWPLVVAYRHDLGPIFHCAALALG